MSGGFDAGGWPARTANGRSTRSGERDSRDPWGSSDLCGRFLSRRAPRTGALSDPFNERARGTLGGAATRCGRLLSRRAPGTGAPSDPFNERARGTLGGAATRCGWVRRRWHWCQDRDDRSDDCIQNNDHLSRAILEPSIALATCQGISDRGHRHATQRGGMTTSPRRVPTRRRRGAALRPVAGPLWAGAHS